MSIIKRMRKQTALYWARSPGTDEFGQFSYALPVEIKCRWDDEAKEFIGAHGTKMISRAVVYVDRDMKLGDKLKLGALADIEDSNDSNDTNDTNDSAVDAVTEAWEIQGWAKNPNLKAKEFLHTAYL